jgi:cell division protein FtsA
MNTKYVISLEIGSSNTKLGAASYDADQGDNAPLTIIAIEEETINNCVRYGRIQNVEDVTRHTMLALDRLSNRTGVYPRNITGVYTAIGGRSLASCKASAQLSLPEESEITKELIERLKDDALLQVPQGRTALDIIPLRYTLDDVVTKRPVGSFGSRIKAEFTIVYCNPLNERNLERVIVERLNLDICGYVVRPIAIANLTLTDEDTKPGCMLVDLGAETTTVSIFKDGALQYVATIPIGSHNITRDLAAGFGVTEEQAEQIKIRLGNAISDSGTLTAQQVDIDNYVQARVSEIIANILAHINFAGYKSSDLCSGIVITGRGSKLRNFCDLLRLRSGLSVRVAATPSAITVADPSINTNDNLDIIAVSREAMLRSQNPNAVSCVTELAPEPEPEPEPVQPEPEKPVATQPVQPEHPAAMYDYTGGTFGGYTIDEKEPQAPTQPAQPTKEVDDEGLLDDYDKEAQIKEKRAKKAEEERKKAEEEERKRREREEKKLINSSPGLLGRLRRKLNDLIEDNGDGNDLDD